MTTQDRSSIADRENIGRRIKSRRQDLGLSLREAARRIEVTASFLSQLERGQSDTSIGVLRRIAAVLGVPMMHFLAEDHPQAPVVRAGERQVIDLPDVRVKYELLVPDLARKMEAVMCRLEPGTGNVGRALREPSEELIVVLAGALRIELGPQAYLLAVGDSIYFNGSDLRVLACASEQEAVWISVITPPVF